jgi:hypothetical protein
MNLFSSPSLSQIPDPATTFPANNNNLQYYLLVELQLLLHTGSVCRLICAVISFLLL